MAGAPEQGSEAEHDELVTAEQSMFGTRLPRPTGVGRHLLVVIVIAAVALGIAIVFAERDSGPAPVMPVNP
jgi:hypothetical protein